VQGIRGIDVSNAERAGKGGPGENGLSEDSGLKRAPRGESKEGQPSRLALSPVLVVAGDGVDAQSPGNRWIDGW
jgi:hypothetical protein